MPPMMGRPGSAALADVYGAGFGSNSIQAGAATSAVMGQMANTAANVTPADPTLALAHTLFTTPAGVLLIIAAALIMFSLAD